MFNKNLAKEAHRMAKEIKGEYPEVNYKFQFGLNVKYLLSKVEEVENTMAELMGSPKQIAWAEKIRSEKMAAWEKEQKDMKDAPNQKYVVELAAAAERIFNIESASNWINLKDHSIISLARADMKKKLNRYCFDIGEEKAFTDRY
jgi:hypothetical protein